ncbi:MAG TPA: hypothetical protein VNO13_02565, partial [Candidatus Udaeobacter sp.]|nr:hypothetical protein [Candidatus Udaeobacter sp.]
MRDKAITATRKSFDVARFLGIVSERRPDLIDAEIYPAFEVHEGVVTPERSLDFLASHDLSGAFRKQQEHSERLR